ncbi:MAG: tetratricopeptide repeat protein [Flavobacteriaceae bacterium]|nr:tetratricopeptide repeat protein [Flavobacteriaceae bacterium]
MKNSIYIVLLFFKIGFSQTSALLFEKGNELYNKGEFELAINEYNKILENDIHSNELYFNMANCYYRLNRVAESNYYFEKALLLSPNNKDIIDNLSFAKNMTLDSIEELPETQLQQNINYIILFFSTRIWAFISIGLMSIFFITALLYLFSFNPNYKRVYFSLSIIFLLISLATSTIIWQESKKSNEIIKGIIFSKELSVFSEPNKRNEEIFVLHEGTKVEILDRLTGWEKIRLANGSEGWVIENQIKYL